MTRSKGSRIVRRSLLGAGVLILAGTAWVGWRSYQAYSHLETAASKVADLQEELRDITEVDSAVTASTVADLQVAALAARSAVDDPVYRAATKVPFVGGNLDAIREVALTVDSLATDVMPSLVDIELTLRPSQIAPKDGTINLQPIQRISPLLQDADAAVRQALHTMAAIDSAAVLAPVGDAVLALSDKLNQAAEIAGPGARIARLLPNMLGAQGPRTYLVVFQNPAEPRATGGVFGSFAVVRAEQGKITILEQGGSARALLLFDPPAAELSADQVTLYGASMATFVQDVNTTPDFPTAAAMFIKMYQLRGGGAVDGVLAIDPVALSYMLEGTPPIDVGDGVLVTSKNLVPVMLSTVYQEFTKGDQTIRDDFLARATGLVFSQLMSGAGDTRSMLDGLRRAAGERRVLMYSTTATEQADLADTAMAGGVTADPSAPSLGVYLNDRTGAKLAYYLRSEVHVTEGRCRTDGRRELLVTVVLHYDAPSSGLPAYVLGITAVGKAYRLRTDVLVFAPSGGSVAGATGPDGAPIDIVRGADHFRDVATTTLEMPTGSSTEVRFTVLGPVVAAAGDATDVPPSLVVTPGVHPWVSSVGGYRQCVAGTG